jgi:two-component system, NtrC family, response regulator AtoC
MPKTKPNGSLDFVVHSPEMVGLLETVRRAAASSANVLILGETGSGKEWIARVLHESSGSAPGPWIDVNCAALPDHLVESELFGYEKGAFSGAAGAKPGLFELADGGTLFLDEIGDLDRRLQGKLLRVLDGAAYFRLGGTRKIRARVRVVAATNRDLKAEVARGSFRLDLYHRLSTVTLRVPALRERRQEIRPLVRYFLDQVRPESRFDEEAMRLLEAHDWPGNVRELKNVVHGAVALTEGSVLPRLSLPVEIREPSANGLGALADVLSAPAPWRLEEVERHAIERALAQTGGHQQRAASLLGVSRRTLSRKLRSYRSQIGV